MSLRKTRKLLSFLLAVVIVIGGNLFFGAELIKYTLCNEKYLSDVVLSASFTDECEKNFADYTQVLSAQSGIPAQVFQVVIHNDELSRNPLTGLFSDNSNIYSKDMVSEFEALCREYLDGNNISYDNAMVRSTAEYAAKAYEDCFYISNMQCMTDFIEKVNENYGKYTSIGLLLIVVSVFLLFLLFRKRSDFVKAVFSAFTALGISIFFIGLFGLIFNVGNSPMLVPGLYSNAAAKAVDGTFIIAAVLGVILTAVSFIGSLYKYKLIKKHSTI